jgi:NRPS condensation-like uncharacterized protein
MPSDLPLWEIYAIPDYTEIESVLVVKLHHSVADGVGGQFCILASSDNFDPKSLPGLREIPILHQIYMSVLGFLTIPLTVIKSLSFKKETNPFTADKDLSGVKKLSSTKEYSLAEIKKIVKNKNKVTINDYFTAVLSTSISKYYEDLGVKDIPSELNLSIPINIRPTLPNSVDSILLGNYFTLELMKLPIIKDFRLAVTNLHERF